MLAACFTRSSSFTRRTGSRPSMRAWLCVVANAWWPSTRFTWSATRDHARTQGAGPVVLEVSGAARTPLCPHPVSRPAFHDPEHVRHELVVRDAAIQRRDHGLHDARGSVERAHIAPVLEKMRLRHMP